MRALLLASILLGASLAGCLGSSDDLEPSAGAVTNTTKEAPVCRLPDGRLCAAANETNKTTVGKGGIEHLHDYWGGETSKLIYEQSHYLSGPVFCDNKDTSKFGCLIVQLPVTTPATLVYEGATSMTIEIIDVQPWVTNLQLRYKNGANPTWGDAIPVPPGEAITLDISSIETDMPHASASQWAWKIFAERSLAFMGPDNDFTLRITVHKGGQIVNWPGHPDFYADKAYRTVMEKSATTKVGGITDSFLYGDEANVIRPDLLISSGTGHIMVYLNVTDVRAFTGDVKPNNFFIEYTNATGYWEGAYRESRFEVNRVFGNQTGPMSWVMRIPTEYTGWDSPYAPVSGWQFLVRSSYYEEVDTPAGKVKQGVCPGCFPYEVDFHMTVIAFPDPKYVGVDDALE